MLSANIVYYSYVYICSIITVSYFVHLMGYHNSGCLDKLNNWSLFQFCIKQVVFMKGNS